MAFILWMTLGIFVTNYICEVETYSSELAQWLSVGFEIGTPRVQILAILGPLGNSK